MLCTRCGRESLATANYCFHCGFKFLQEVEQPSFAENEQILRTIRHLYVVNKPAKVVLSYLRRLFGIEISERTLRRICAENNIKRYNPNVTVEELSEIIKKELNDCRQECGYRRMTIRVRLKYGMLVTRKQVYDVMTILDHANVHLRQARAFRGRKYYSKGPNWIWHIDQYDKLSQYGFCIHGAIDGFSRKILWAKVYITNSDPWVIANYFFDQVVSTGGCPQRVRVDCGTENTLLTACEIYLRRNHDDEFAGGESVIYGKSKFNQRIEAWWSSLRKGSSNFWINYFKDMESSGIWCRYNSTHRLCLLYVFMPILETALSEFRQEYNAYNIRKQKDRLCPPGVPDDNYAFPESHGFEDQGRNVTETDLAVIARENGFGQPLPDYLDQDFRSLADEFVTHYSLVTMPLTNLEQAKELYSRLVQYFGRLSAPVE